ncbi:uncharacterized protein LACBIDRAFT_330409 [Laccaria bicolor S238N-H82]|uniref:Predicted protein n=1 Tax=Laccaria bicolor (strain S238N-H82 / ATCC MYA-4686) TaxID=486041 RepID=B0DL78_LACBS|nr:uncharacterized protein LACBIDRAFT_330409 [Laccaria bicolor S238N-H82]EDR04514.1 predicted protein [Laccaria bicolor S238N-H82]|eukprot:XP_001884686.1 predicted protein [Laccaria bicolor S238N-H82]
MCLFFSDYNVSVFSDYNVSAFFITNVIGDMSIFILAICPVLSHEKSLSYLIKGVQDSVPALPDNTDDVVTMISATEPDAPVPPSNSLSSATAEGMNDEDEDDPGRPHLPPCIELISLGHFDNIKIAALNSV